MRAATVELAMPFSSASDCLTVAVARRAQLDDDPIGAAFQVVRTKRFYLEPMTVEQASVLLAAVSLSASLFDTPSIAHIHKSPQEN
jgi:hypothetical protein